VPSVASEPPTPAFKPSLPNPARAAQSSDRGQPSPFDALLDAGTQAAVQAAQAPPPPVDTTQTAPTDSAQPPAKSQAKDSDAPKTANTDTTSTTADAGNSDATATGGTAVSNVKVKADAKMSAQAATADDSKPAGDKPSGDGQPADGLKPAVHTALLANNAAQAVLPTAALVTTPGHPAIVAAETSKAKTTGDVNSSSKTALAPQGDGKTQPATGDADKLITTPTHDEAPATGHHTATAEAPPAIIADAQTPAPKTFADAVQQATLAAPSQDVTQTAANPAAPAQPIPQALAVPLAGVAIEIAGKALEGKNRFEIRLDPPELGRIEVRLDVDRDGNAVTRLIADRSDTLDLLRRDANSLQQALQDAGLKTSDNGLQFSLRDQTMGRDQSNTPMPAAAQIVVQDDTLAGTDIGPLNYPRLAGLGAGIDIRV
jgi:flagellar hook-length control protein FliK